MAEAGFDLQNVAEEDLIPDSAEPEVSFGYMDASAKQPWRLRLNEHGRRALDSEMEEIEATAASTRRPSSIFLKQAVGLSPEDIAAKKGLGYTPTRTRRSPPSGGLLRRRVLPPPLPPSTRSVRWPPPARRCHRSPPTSSPSCSPGSPSIP